MEILYPDEYFLDLLEEDLYNFNKESDDYLTINMDLDSTIHELNGEYLESIKKI
ncbi:hypothetical protein [Clostridium sp. L74]|uniref:hypothetical protein n=1 Tax=Clostridium sp. L74 TaxID=1560217 RepID=UPI0006BF6065|nr:hypothetical protein [Clostridium sp. L74]KOR25587.1 hypothetical protein ND00_14360 [Clostridium sp. L74]